MRASIFYDASSRRFTGITSWLFIVHACLTLSGCQYSRATLCRSSSLLPGPASRGGHCSHAPISGFSSCLASVISYELCGTVRGSFIIFDLNDYFDELKRMSHACQGDIFLIFLAAPDSLPLPITDGEIIRRVLWGLHCVFFSGMSLPTHHIFFTSFWTTRPPVLSTTHSFLCVCSLSVFWGNSWCSGMLTFLSLMWWLLLGPGDTVNTNCNFCTTFQYFQGGVEDCNNVVRTYTWSISLLHEVAATSFVSDGRSAYCTLFRWTNWPTWNAGNFQTLLIKSFLYRIHAVDINLTMSFFKASSHTNKKVLMTGVVRHNTHRGKSLSRDHAR